MEWRGGAQQQPCSDVVQLSYRQMDEGSHDNWLWSGQSLSRHQHHTPVPTKSSQEFLCLVQ